MKKDYSNRINLLQDYSSMMGLCATLGAKHKARTCIAKQQKYIIQYSREIYFYLNNKAVFHGKTFYTASAFKFKLKLIITKLKFKLPFFSTPATFEMFGSYI